MKYYGHKSWRRKNEIKFPRATCLVLTKNEPIFLWGQETNYDLIQQIKTYSFRSKPDPTQNQQLLTPKPDNLIICPV